MRLSLPASKIDGMTTRDPTASDEDPLGKGWKTRWREEARGKTPSDLKKLREEKRAERKRAHKRSRRNAKQKIDDERAE